MPFFTFNFKEPYLNRIKKIIDLDNIDNIKHSQIRYLPVISPEILEVTSSSAGSSLM